MTNNWEKMIPLHILFPTNYYINEKILNYHLLGLHDNDGSSTDDDPPKQ